MNLTFERGATSRAKYIDFAYLQVDVRIGYRVYMRANKEQFFLLVLEC